MSYALHSAQVLPDPNQKGIYTLFARFPLDINSMISELGIITILLLSLLYIKRLLYLAKWNHFPGPSTWTSIPWIGHAYLLGSDPTTTLFKLQEKYGNVFRLDILGFPTVIICGFEGSTETYKKEVMERIDFAHLQGDPELIGEKIFLQRSTLTTVTFVLVL